MQIPTRWIDNDEFQKLCALETNPDVPELTAIMIYQLNGYRSPIPEDVATGRGIVDDTRHVDIIFLHAAEPCLYKDKMGLKIILPKFEDYDFDYWKQLLPMESPWLYTVAPHGWDIAGDFNMIDADYYFAEVD